MICENKLILAAKLGIFLLNLALRQNSFSLRRSQLLMEFVTIKTVHQNIRVHYILTYDFSSGFKDLKILSFSLIKSTILLYILKVSVEDVPRDLSFSSLMPCVKSHTFKGKEMAHLDCHLLCSVIPNFYYNGFRSTWKYYMLTERERVQSVSLT